VSNRQTTVRAKDQAGREVELRDNHSDAPLIPIAAIERLHQVRPDLVDWVFNETQTEA
jgi:hypothetical protein